MFEIINFNSVSGGSCSCPNCSDQCANVNSSASFVVNGSDHSNCPTQDSDEESDIVVSQDQAYMEYHCLQSGSSKFALKRLKPRTNESEKDLLALTAGIDLAMEAKFLNVLCAHPNIVRLRATVGLPGSADFSLILDRVVDTLDNRIDAWRSATKARGAKWRNLSSGIFRKRNTSPSQMNQLLVLQDVASAMKHLHSKEYV